MIVFDAYKEKKLEMTVETKGIQPQNLKFYFRIVIEGVEYGFPCTLVGQKVSVTIPPLSEVVVKELMIGNYDAKLEVTGENKYYLNPFKDKIKIIIEPKVEVTMEKETEQVVEIVEMKMSSIVDKDIEDKKPVVPVEEKKDKTCDKKPKKKSKFAKSLK